MEEYIIAIPNRKPGEPDPAVVRSEIVGKLVRCEDCNFLEKNTGVVHFPNAVGICKKLGIYPSGDWFCANGVKKE